jgi:hypothetical protein
MSRWTNVRYDRRPAVRKSVTSGRKNDYLEGPFPWTRQQAIACFEAHGWGGGKCLLVAMRNAWADPRPACYPSHEVMDAETAVAVALAKWAEVRGITNTIEGQLALSITTEEVSR